MDENNHEERIPWTAIAGIVLTAFVLGAILNSPETGKAVCARWIGNENFKTDSCLLNYISEFQTLITGLAAVCAAYLTVREMRKTEEKQHQRHQEVMTLSVRDEYNALTRLLIPYADKLKDAFDILFELENRCPDTPQERDDFILTEYQSIHNAFEAISGFLESAAFQQSERYFNGALAHELTVLPIILGPGIRAVEEIRQFRGSRHSHQEHYYFDNWVYGENPEGEYGADRIRRVISDGLPHLRKVVCEFERVQRKLQALAKAYPELEMS
ncbi:hypothetical protein G6L63_11195 [Agrobacterium vitis]|uniref:hypothetical protein n=1 Tax=Agrobacterium vitis TaxID=373 RepID=UPI00157372A7|nr:hypothetical protein [Agrobacterium vitis]NSZ48475.1 hypothetical protein [Agrobacterium vitis]UJL73070.1 hypothetical protein AVCG412_09725 [Agrobacterium vitis]